MEEAVRIYERFAEHAFSLADTMRAEGIRVYIFFAPGPTKEDVERWVGRSFEFIEQQGEDLGRRMQNAFDVTFAEGAGATVIIGTDVPELDVATIQAAFKVLATKDVVIGQSDDGGYYLLGMHAPTKPLFDDVHWSSESVFDETVERVNSFKLSHAYLPVLHDIDTEEDLRNHSNRNTRKPFSH